MAMTPDLPTRVREAFDAEFDARRSLAARPRMDAALAAVIAVVQEDTADTIAEWVCARFPAQGVGAAIFREFGGTTHD